MAERPQDPGVQVLAAKVNLATNDSASAEKRLLDVIRTSPQRLDAYELLGALYTRQGNVPAALDKYRTLAARAPDATGPATMVGMLLESTGDKAGARAEYEAILAKAPNSGIAANNLAWMLAQEGQLDSAQRLAQVSADVLRGRPEPQDTLGYIYLQKKMPTEAYAAFERALSFAPKNETYLKHAAEAKQAMGK